MIKIENVLEYIEGSRFNKILSKINSNTQLIVNKFKNAQERQQQLRRLKYQRRAHSNDGVSKC